MDMDFLTEFNDLHQADLIGSIDNETVETYIPDNFIQGVAFVGNIDDNSSNNTLNNNGNGHNHSTNTASNALESTKAPATTGTGTLTTISAHISVTSAPIGTTTALALPQTATQAHLPESPPDSGSEPPYSPLQETHGLTLTARDTFDAGISHDLPFAAQYTTTNAAAAQSHQHPQQQQQHQFAQSPPSLEGVRFKHENGLIINPTALLQAQQNPHQMQHTHHHHHHQQQQQQQQQHFNLQPPQHHNTHETHIDMSQQTLIYANNNIMHYDPPPYPTNVGYAEALANTSICGTILNDMAHVEVVGTQTPRTSAPTTPVHNTRKRKMSTQLDYVEYPNIKSDPGLKMSPMCESLAKRAAPTSPASLQNEILATPAHSSASISPALSTVNSNNDNSMDGTANGQGGNANGDANGDPNAMSPCIRFTPFQPQNWHKLCDQRLQDLSVVYYRVDADKGFNFSVSDEAFVCQKKNHFQITCHARLQADAKFVKTPSGIEKIKSFHLHFYGVKLEAPNQTIRVEQSQSDRSKKPFFPVPIDLQCHIVSKITVGRLHFSETTNNNMRKKGRPNPEQRYFQLVVALHVHTASGNYPVISQASERIIVRASNPGQFESDVDLCWQRGLTQDSIFHAGRVGINTDRPDESLVVHGNLKISGHIVQPSDSRAKQEIAELDTSVQLRNLQKIRIVRYRYEPEFAIHSGLKRGSSSDSEEIVDTGVIAQEVREVIPDAVQEAGSVVLPNGNVIENFLLVNKDRILMENIGAVKELCKQTGALTNRVEYLERVNTQLVRSKEFEQKYLRNNAGKMCSKSDGFDICSNRTLQIFIIILVTVMAICLAAVSTIYFLEHNQRQNNILKLEKLYFGQNEQEHYYLQELQHNKTKHPCQSSINSSATTTTTTRPPSFLNALKPKLSEELVNNDAPHNDDHDVYLERAHFPPPIIAKHINHITTTAPVLRNKTISRNKSKYSESLPNEVPSLMKLASAAIRRHSNLNENTTAAAQKPVDTVLLPQDFENNSIDVDAQQIPKKTAAGPNKLVVGDNHIVVAVVARDPHTAGTLGKTINANEQAHDEITFNNPDELAKIVGHLASTLSTNNHVPVATTTTTSATTSAQREPLISYKTVSPPTDVQLLTTNNVANEAVQRNYSIETPPITNHSKGVLENTLDNPDANDLQVLSATNETVDNPITAVFGFDAGPVRESNLGRRSTTNAHIWAVQSNKEIDVFGEPPQCVAEQKTTCQSTCSANDLIKHVAGQQQQQQAFNQQSVDTVLNLASLEDDDEDGDNFKIKPIAVETAKTTQNKANAQTKNEREQPAQEEDDLEDDATADAETPELNGQLYAVEKLNVKAKLTDMPKVIQSMPKLSNTPITSCNRVTGTLVANGHNSTFDTADYCQEAEESMQVTYTIPISRYLLAETIELHLSFSKPLHWHLCKNNLIRANTSNKKLINTQTHQQHNSANVIHQRQGNKAILFIDIPQQGTFEREIILRAVNDTKTQNVCSDSTTTLAAFNTRLQYNFRILRYCD